MSLGDGADIVVDQAVAGGVVQHATRLQTTQSPGIASYPNIPLTVEIQFLSAVGIGGPERPCGRCHAVVGLR
jgi:hypothetical protein